MLKSWPREQAGEEAAPEGPAAGRGCRNEAGRETRSLVPQTSGQRQSVCLEHLLPETQRPPERSHFGRHRHPAPSTHTRKRAKRCSVSRSLSNGPPSNRSANVNWASTEDQALPCSPARGEALVNQIITPGKDNHRDASAAGKGPQLRRVQNTAATLGVSPRTWELGMGEKRAGPAVGTARRGAWPTGLPAAVGT